MSRRLWRRSLLRRTDLERPLIGVERTSFAAKVNTIMRRQHTQGTLRRLSLKYFHDFAGRASHFDITRLGQKIV